MEQKVQHLNKSRSEIISLIDNNDSFVDINYKISEFRREWAKFVDSHHGIVEFSDSSDSEFTRLYNHQMSLTAEFEKKVERWKVESSKKKVISGSIFSSERSTSSSVNLLKKKESVAVAQLKLEKLKKQQEIARKIHDLQMENDILDAEREAAEAMINLQTLEDIDKVENGSQGVENESETVPKRIISKQDTDSNDNVVLSHSKTETSFNLNLDNNVISHNVNQSVDLPTDLQQGPSVRANFTSASTFIPTMSSLQSIPVYNSSASYYCPNSYNSSTIVSSVLNSKPLPTPYVNPPINDNRFVQSDFVPYNSPFNNNSVPFVNHNNPYVPNSALVNNDSNLVNKLCQIMSTPKLEYMTFDGNPLRYISFMHNFEECLEKFNPEESRRLQLLIQHCTGKAKECVESCVNLPSEIGYQTAKRSLLENFGRLHVIAKAHINKLESLPVIKQADSNSLLEFCRHLEIAFRTLSGMGDDYVSDLNHTNTLRELNNKLAVFLKAKWTERVGKLIDYNRRPKFLDFVNFVKERAHLVNNEFGEDLNVTFSRDKKVDKFKKSVGNNSSYRHVTTLATGFQKSDDSPKFPNCELCSDATHPIWRCDSFESMSNCDKAKVVHEKKLCIKCLHKGHISKDCPKHNFKCLLRGCGKGHNTLLHDVDFSIVRNPSSIVNRSNSIPRMSSTTTAATGAGVSRVCLGIVPVKITIRNSRTIFTYALLDTGSELSLVLRRLVEILGYCDKTQRLTLTGITGSVELESQSVPLTVKSLDDQTVVELEDVRSLDCLPISETCVPTLSDVRRWSHLGDIPYEQLDSLEVGLVIGLKEKPHLFIPIESRVGGPDEPIALKYSLGWAILGPVSKDNCPDRYSVNFVGRNQPNREEDIKFQLERLWTADFGDIGDDRICMSLEDRRALHIIENGITMVNDHFQVPLPWKHDPPYLPNNRSIAEQRVYGLKRRLYSNPDLYEKYTATIEDYILKGHAVRIPDDEINVTDKPVWYLPHHPVIHPLKDKVRVVFDCAVKFHTTLNQQLLQGPDFAYQLVGVLMRFRQGPIGIISDVEAMFHQIFVDPKDYDAFRFLWFKENDLSGDLVEYRMIKHIFGATSSPCIASYCLHKSAELFKDFYDSDIINSVLRNMYVDDLMKAVDSFDSALKIVTELPEMLSKCGFRLTKWCSNDRRVLSAIPASERAKSVIDLELDYLPTESALGLKWNTETDCFILKVPDSLLDCNKPVTRRNILSVVASLFDPVGFISPYVMKGKLILQMTCRKKLGWDDPLEDSDKDQWMRWLSDMKKLPDIEIARCLFPKDFQELKCIQLHMFSDASRVGYSAVAYLRFIDVDGRIGCSFIIGKSRLAPVREISIPRLELSAAVISVHLKKRVVQELDLKIDQVFYWTDSRSVLKCIHNESRRFQTFESNRLTVIHTTSNPSEWRWVNRDDNPADDGSKGLKLNSTIKNNRWINGPEFLLTEEENWPDMIDIPEINDGDPEIRKEALIYVVATKDETLLKLLNHYSSWWKLKRAVAWLLRLKSLLLQRIRVKRNQDKSEEFSNHLTLAEISKAEFEIIRLVQKEAFPETIKLLESDQSKKSSKSLPKEAGNSLYKLSPYLKDDLLRVGGRLDNAPVEDEFKHPVILPYNHFITDLVISDYHSRVGHLGQESVLCALRQKFWIIKGRSAVRRVISKCVDCQKRKKIPESQFMADLPKSRLTPDKPPFSYVGIDYFGPLLIKQARSTVKRYGCLFTCLNSRAVHIEIAHSLNTDSMINCLRRFISIRGYADVIYSDNGSNFTSAEKDLREALQTFEQSKLNNFCLQKDIIWKFNPPAASHMGGIWERMNRSVRQILKSLLKEQLVTDEVLLTVIAEVVYILNNRPLTRNSESVFDLQPLTPNHLLQLRPCPSLPPGTFHKEDLYLKRKWRQAQYLSEIFWKRWLKEYIPTLMERTKWQNIKRNICINDVVLLVDTNYPRGQWPLGVVVDVIKSKDGLVRSVKLRTKSTVATAVKNRKNCNIDNGCVILTRPVTKICLLELDRSI